MDEKTVNNEQLELNIDENINISGSINVKNENGISTQVMYMNCSLNADTFGSNINVVVNDKNTYKTNEAEIKEKYSKFKALVEKRAEELGNVVF